MGGKAAGLGALIEAGFEVPPYFVVLPEADLNEQREAIGEALNANGKVIVTGCLGAEEQYIRGAHPSVLVVTGPHQYEQVLDAVHEAVPPEPRGELHSTKTVPFLRPTAPTHAHGSHAAGRAAVRIMSPRSETPSRTAHRIRCKVRPHAPPTSSDTESLLTPTRTLQLNRC